MATLNDVDMDTDSDNEESKTTKMIDTTGKQKEIDIDDEAVKDRWSRYIGAMGVEAVAKQAAANIFVSGAGALGIEISKNLVLSGCKSFTLHDTKPITNRDLSGQFFLNEIVEGKTRAEECMPRLS
jgi:tRNA A37 threonylcarbamoyladenosine dehydratase